jgi:hypothetical protein
LAGNPSEPRRDLPANALDSTGGHVVTGTFRAKYQTRPLLQHLTAKALMYAAVLFFSTTARILVILDISRLHIATGFGLGTPGV